MASRRWEVELDGRRRTIELHHATWSHRARLLVDGAVIAQRNVLLALGYDRAADLMGMVGGHAATAAIRVSGTFRASYRYDLLIDGVPAAGSEAVTPAREASMRPTVVGIVETIVWASLLSAAARTLANGSPVSAVLLIPGAILASVILRRQDLPTSWRIVGATLAATAWVLGVLVFIGPFRTPGGL